MLSASFIINYKLCTCNITCLYSYTYLGGWCWMVSKAIIAQHLKSLRSVQISILEPKNYPRSSKN